MFFRVRDHVPRVNDNCASLPCYLLLIAPFLSQSTTRLWGYNC
jgi:hypothetical protein